LILLVLLLAALLGPSSTSATALTATGRSDLAVPLVHFAWPLPPPHPVLRPFQPPTTPYGPGHRGVDLGGTVGEAVLAAGDGLVLYAGPLADRSLVSVEHLDGLRTTYEPITPTVRVGDHVRRGQVIGYLLPGHLGCPLPGSPAPAGIPPPGMPSPLSGSPLPGSALPGSRLPGSPSSRAPLAGPAAATAPQPAVGPTAGPGSGPVPTVCLHWGVHRGDQYLDPLRLVESGRIRLLPWPPGEP
jgi:hypothetical protein